MYKLKKIFSFNYDPCQSIKKPKLLVVGATELQLMFSVLCTCSHLKALCVYVYCCVYREHFNTFSCFYSDRIFF